MRGCLWLIPLFPLVGALVNATLGWRFERAGRKGFVHVVGVGAMIASLALALSALVELRGLAPDDRLLKDTLWNMATAGRLSFDLGIALDPLSMMMVLVVTLVGTLIHVFSIGYMWDDEARSYWRFFAWLNLFVFSMLLLVMGDGFVLLFFGWEGVGLCSYGLVAYYYTDREKAAAGMKAFVVNRIGDLGFLVGLLLLFWGLGGAWPGQGRGGSPRYRPTLDVNALAPATDARAARALAPRVDVGGGQAVRMGPTLNFRELRDQIVEQRTGVAEHLRHERVLGVALATLIGFFLFVGAMGKSAQFPLHTWLPDAMAGPTPVSALIHAATMVTAGVYMVARLHFLFALSPSAMGWVALVGAATALFAASIGLFQHDIKKVLAYSTVSQLGFMFVGVGVGAFQAGAYHLLNHAFFKACLFLAAGSVILGCHHEQDMRRMGGLARRMPITRWAYLTGCVAIAGFPIASGFFSKDEILWRAFTARHLALFGMATPWLGPALCAVGILAATGTSFYMFRSYFMTFTGEYRGDTARGGEPPPATGEASTPSRAHGHAHAPRESPLSVTLVLALLAAGSVLTLLLGLPRLWTGEAPLLERWLEPALPAAVEHAPRWMEWLFQGAGVAASAVGLALAQVLYRDGRSALPARLQERFHAAWAIVYRKYYVDEVYDRALVRPALALSRALSWIDAYLVDGLVKTAGAAARLLAALDDAIDRHVVDGTVSLVANATIRSGRALRRIQTGRVQTYVYGAVAGALAVILLDFLIR